MIFFYSYYLKLYFIYLGHKYNYTFLNKLENILNAKLFVSGSRLCFSYNINNLQSKYLISPESYEILNKN
jgi:hypothetical protein